jgi:hypothetical protein
MAHLFDLQDLTRTHCVDHTLTNNRLKRNKSKGDPKQVTPPKGHAKTGYVARLGTGAKIPTARQESPLSQYLALHSSGVSGRSLTT